MSGEGAEITTETPSTVAEVDELLARGHAILFRTAAGDVGMKLYHREGQSHPIRTVDYPQSDITRYYGHADAHVSDWLDKYGVEIEPGGGYASEPEST